MSEMLVVLSSDDVKSSRQARQELVSGVGKITQAYGDEVLIVETDSGRASALETHPGIVGIYPDTVPEEVMEALDETGKMGVAAWNQRRHPSYREAKKQRKGEGLSWGHPDYEREG